MSTIASLLVNLKASTGHYERGMAKARRKTKLFGGAVSSVTGLLGTFGVALGAAGIIMGIKSVVSAYGRQEAAVKSLSDALDLLGKGGADTMKDMQRFAAGIQKVTTVGDEAVLELASLGASLGKLSGEGLKKATTAAIGLSKRMQVDTVTAMRLVARAAVGDTATLARYGIKLDQTMTQQEKFNAVLDMGSEAFALAKGETSTFRGQMEQLKNTLGDIKESIGAALVPAILRFVKRLQSAIEWVRNLNKGTVQTIKTIAKWVIGLTIAIKVIKLVRGAIYAIVAAYKALAAAKAISQAFSGPAGWATLAAGAVIATGAVIGINKAFSDLEDKAGDASAAIAHVKVQNDALTGSLKETAVVAKEAAEKIASVQSVRDKRLADLGAQLRKDLDAVGADRTSPGGYRDPGTARIFQRSLIDPRGLASSKRDDRMLRSSEQQKEKLTDILEELKLIRREKGLA